MDKIHQIKVVVFDYDDTLVKSSDALYEADSKTAASLGLKKPTREEYFSHWGKTHHGMIKSLHPATDPDLYIKTYKDEIYDPSDLKLFPIVKRMLERLKEKGMKLAVLTAKQRAFLDGNMKHNQIDKYFDYVHSVESCPYTKPDPRVFDDILEYFNVKPSEMLYVGDHPSDFEAATTAGLRFIAVTTGIDGPEVFRKRGCMEIISSLSELEERIG